MEETRRQTIWEQSKQSFLQLLLKLRPLTHNDSVTDINLNRYYHVQYRVRKSFFSFRLTTLMSIIDGLIMRIFFPDIWVKQDGGIVPLHAFFFAITFPIYNCRSKLIFVDLQCKKIEIVELSEKECKDTINYVQIAPQLHI